METSKLLTENDDHPFEEISVADRIQIMINAQPITSNYVLLVQLNT